VDLIKLHVLIRSGREHVRRLERGFGDETIRRWIIAKQGRGLTVSQMSLGFPNERLAAGSETKLTALLWENR
jgi:hypothetical protein